MTVSLQDQATLDEPARQGASRVEWIRSRMPLMKSVREEFERSRPFEGHRIGVSLHIEPKTAVLLEILQAGGADIVGTGNFGSTQDDVAAWLRTLGMEVLGRRDDTFDSHQRNLEDVMDANPDVLLDNGADLAAEAVRRGATGTIIGATEETTSGGNRLRGEIEDRLTFPCIVINDSPLKAIAENRHAVGQSVVESFMRITNLMIPGRRFVVAGYGWCGRGIAQCFRAFGGKVAIVETDEIKALEACLDGCRVGHLEDFLDWGEVFVTATGARHVITAGHARRMTDGAVLMNAGHFPWEIEVDGIRRGGNGHACHGRRGRAAGPAGRTAPRRGRRRPYGQSCRTRAQGELDRVDGPRLHPAGVLAPEIGRRARACRWRPAGAGRHQPTHLQDDDGSDGQRALTVASETFRIRSLCPARGESGHTDLVGADRAS